MTGVENDIARLAATIDELRRIRHQTCAPRSNLNPRYLALSNAVSSINRAIETLRAENVER